MKFPRKSASAAFVLATRSFPTLVVFCVRLHSLCILQGGGGGGEGGQKILEGVLKFLEQKKGGYKNCLNISWGDAYFL